MVKYIDPISYGVPSTHSVTSKNSIETPSIIIRNHKKVRTCEAYHIDSIRINKLNEQDKLPVRHFQVSASSFPRIHTPTERQMTP